MNTSSSSPLCPPFHCFVLRTPACTYTLWREGEIGKGAVVMAELDYRETDAEGLTRHVESYEDRHTGKPLPNRLRELLTALCILPEQPDENGAAMELTTNNRVHRWNPDTPQTHELYTSLRRELYAMLPALHGCKAAAPGDEEE